MKFAVITLPYSMETDEGTAAGPKALLQAGLADWLREQGHEVAGPFDVKLTPDEQSAYVPGTKLVLPMRILLGWSRKQRRHKLFPCF
jgi:arginase family enzyme